MPDTSLGTLDWGDFPALSHAQAMLALNAKDYKLDVVFQTHIPAMVATLNFYLSDLSFTWRQASILAAKAGGYLCKEYLDMDSYIPSFWETPPS